MLCKPRQKLSHFPDRLLREKERGKKGKKREREKERKK